MKLEDRDDRDRGTDFPRLKGYCPACGNTTLFRGSQGYIICSWLKCPNPGAAHDALKVTSAAVPVSTLLTKWEAAQRQLGASPERGLQLFDDFPAVGELLEHVRAALRVVGVRTQEEQEEHEDLSRGGSQRLPAGLDLPRRNDGDT